jgi:hypothetical protein
VVAVDLYDEKLKLAERLGAEFAEHPWCER